MVEFVVAIGIGVMVLAVFMSFAIYQGRSFSVILNLVDMDELNRNALNRMAKEIRQVNKVTFYGTNWVDFEDFDKGTLTYRFDPGTRTLTRIKGTSTIVVLKEIDSFTFALMQRNIVEGSYAYYPAESVEECKVIGITWETSRSIMGRKTGVSGSQTARIVIRKG
jgi:hypothetical protein